MREWLRWNWEMLTVIGVLALLIGGIVWLVVRDASWWSRYSIEHHCIRTGNMRSGYTTFMTTSCGQNCTMTVPITTPDDHEYLCDDQSRHWR